MLSELNKAALEALFNKKVISFKNNFFLFNDLFIFNFNASLGAYEGVSAFFNLVSSLSEGL